MWSYKGGTFSYYFVTFKAIFWLRTNDCTSGSRRTSYAIRASGTRRASRTRRTTGGAGRASRTSRASRTGGASRASGASGAVCTCGTPHTGGARPPLGAHRTHWPHGSRRTGRAGYRAELGTAGTAARALRRLLGPVNVHRNNKLLPLGLWRPELSALQAAGHRPRQSMICTMSSGAPGASAGARIFLSGGIDFCPSLCYDRAIPGLQRKI